MTDSSSSRWRSLGEREVHDGSLGEREVPDGSLGEREVPDGSLGERGDLVAELSADAYRSYTYGYPHKTAYRAFEPPIPLRELWRDEDQRHLFGYVHLPFCEMRCGFCNLFTTANPADDLVTRYLAAFEREVAAMADVLDSPRASRFALGGGTPTYLDVDQMERVLSLLEGLFGTRIADVPTAVETSPATATPERIAHLAERGVRRVSIGVQSMLEGEVHGVGRPQRHHEVEAALETIKGSGIPVLNIDLMYGLAHQTPQTWLTSLERVLAYEPQEVFCYPLYVRPLTGLDGRASWDDTRRGLYRLAVERLTDAGFRQTSMRRFTRVPDGPDLEYTCQTDGMVGLGCGARSYTRATHYSREWAVGRTGVKQIIGDYIERDDFTTATHGFLLDDDERLRRYVLQSLLHVDGLDLDACRAATGMDAYSLPLDRLAEAKLAEETDGVLRLTALGMELSDAIGPWLYSPSVVERRRTFDLR